MPRYKCDVNDVKDVINEEFFSDLEKVVIITGHEK